MEKDANVKDRNSEKTTEEAVKEPLNQVPAQSESEPEVPLFLRYSSEGKKGDAQDEKDKSAE